MTATLSSLFDSAMQLPDDSRLQLVELLIPTIRSEPALEAEQLVEVHRRIDDVRSGRVQTIPGGQVFRDIGQAATRIQRTPGVCGGEACVGDTRIAVWMLEAARRAGVTDSGLLQDYPALGARELAAAWSYAEANGEEINKIIRANNNA